MSRPFGDITPLNLMALFERLAAEREYEKQFEEAPFETEHPPLFETQTRLKRPREWKWKTRLSSWFKNNPWTDPQSPFLGERVWTRRLSFRVMDASIGVNLRVTAHSNQGGRKYMEDMFCVAYQPTSDEKDLLYAYFGIFDGHGGREAALYAKTHLMDHIVSQKNFWSDDDEMVMKAIRDGFVSVHHAMWRELDKWPKTQSGLPSTSGTTASVAFVRRGKLYIGHVGDSGIVLGYQDPNSSFWKARPLTNDHKPESPMEHARIQECGGKVVSKSGVPRVVWNRPRLGHQGPVRRSTLIDEIPFLAVARSLGDLWSYNSEQNEFVVSPVPDVSVIEIDVNTHRCLILGSDGLWNMLTCQDAVNSVYFAEKNNERHHQQAIAEGSNAGPKNWINPSKRLVDRALDRWYGNNLRADNTSVVTVVIDPPGPPKKQPSPRQSNAATSTSSQASPRASCSSSVRPSTPSPRFSRILGNSRYSDTISPPRSVPRPVGHQRGVVGRPKSAERAGSGPPSSRESPVRRPVPDRANRRNRAQPVVSSKTSRVLARSSSNVSAGSDSSQSGLNSLTSSSSNESLSDNQDDLDESNNGDDVQINEISSSCETNRADGAEARESMSPVESTQKAGEKKGMRKVNKRIPKTSGTSLALSTNSASSRKRMARNSEVALEEPDTQRKIMKVSNESIMQRRPPVAKKGSIAGQGKGGRSKLRNRSKVAVKINPSAEKISRPATTSVAEAKENGRKLSRRVSTPSISTRATRGAAARETPIVEPSTADDTAAASSPAATLENSKKSVKVTDASEPQNATEAGGTRVTTAKKPLRGVPHQVDNSNESQEAPSTSKRITRGLGTGTPTPPTSKTVGKPLKQQNALTNMTKRVSTSAQRSASRGSRASLTDASPGAQNPILKVKLKRLNGKGQTADKEPSPPRRSAKQTQAKRTESADEGAGGASRERNLRSSSSAALRVTRSKAKK